MTWLPDLLDVLPRSPHTLLGRHASYNEVVRRNRPRFTGKIDLSGRDEQASAEVAAILAELPADHAARIAFVEEKDAIALTHLLAERIDLVKRLVETVFARSDRIHGNYRRG